MRLHLAITASGLAVLGQGCSGDGHGPAVAKLAAAQGAVTVTRDDAGAAAVQGAELFEEDVVTTPAGGSAVVAFDGGNSVQLGASTSLVIRRREGVAAQLGAVLLSGSARASSKGQGVAFVLGTPFGYAELGTAASDVDVDATQGLVVRLGKIEVVTDDGKHAVIEAGQTYSVKGLVVPLGDAPEALPKITLQPLTFVLLANPTQVQVKRKDEAEWRAPSKRDALSAGDAVRTRKASGTRMQLGDHTGVTLQRDTELLVAEAGHDGARQQAHFVLSTGNAAFEIERRLGTETQHTVEVAGSRVTIEAGREHADVEVSAGSSGRAQLAVRLGKATLADGTVVEAGSSVNLEAGKLVGEARPMAATHVTVRAPSSSQIYYGSEVPAVRFVWDQKAGERSVFELARDKDFSQLELSEEVQAGSFLWDRLKPGRYHFRVKGGANAEGTVLIDKAREDDGKSYKRTNTVDDTGEKTVVYYQKTLPAITLRWASTPGAAKYRVKVFADGAFDKPLVDELVAETTLALKSGQLSENRFFWLVLGLDEAGRDIATGRMNSLTIAYDNAVSDIVIKSPKPGQTVRGTSLVASGEVELGNRLFVNGKAAGLDGKGRFKETVALERGQNQVVFRTVGGGGSERFYVREVVRR